MFKNQFDITNYSDYILLDEQERLFVELIPTLNRGDQNMKTFNRTFAIGAAIAAAVILAPADFAQ